MAENGGDIFRELDGNFLNFDESNTDVYNFMSTDIVIHWNWKLDIPITLPGSVVSYTFSTTPGDISFGISFQTHDGVESEVLVPHRVPSEIEPISGSFKAPKEGAICLYWDNSFSWLTPKKLSYSVEVRQPSFEVADHIRAMKAHALIASSSKELHALEAELAETVEKERMIRAEIPELKRQFDEIKAKIENKLAIVATTSQQSNELAQKIELGEKRITALCIRLLKKEVLQEVFSFLDDTISLQLVCKYWAAVVKENKRK